MTGDTRAAGAGLALDLGWDALDRIVAELADQMTSARVPEVVVGVVRGGMVPAVMLAHRLGVRAVRAVTVTHTLVEGAHAPKSATPVIADASELTGLAERDVLVVDDVAGSGATMRVTTDLLERLGPARVRSVVTVVNAVNWAAANPARSPAEHFDHVGTTCAGWVRFPWETR